jgi:alanyl-tRNA synthetase
MGDPYTELTQRRDVIVATLSQEEEAFGRTLSAGIERFSASLARLGGSKGTFPGEEAFFLSDTFGFPLEVTQELAIEHGMHVDLDEFARLMKEAQERSRAAQGAQDVFGGENEALVISVSEAALPYTVFVGYETTSASANIVQISPRFGEDGRSTGDFQVCLDQTPFYAQSGGQVGDTGRLVGDEVEFEVTNTWKAMGLIWHDARLTRFGTAPRPFVGLTPEDLTGFLGTGVLQQPVQAEVDAARRRDITRNHTATHLLHAALRAVLGDHVSQAGSLVAPDRLRFDFTHGAALSREQVDDIEALVNRMIAAATPVCVHDGVRIEEAKRRGAMMLFGEKYGDEVRMIEVGDVSLELCGGNHVSTSSEIGLFKIVGEASSASGVRRIEAVTGAGAYAWVHERERLLTDAAAKLKAAPADLARGIERLQDALRDVMRERDALLAGSSADTPGTTVDVGPLKLLVQKVTTGGEAAAKLAVDRMVESDPRAVAIVGLAANGSVTFFCKVGKGAEEAGAHAGNLIRAVAKVAGGGGGGSAQFAQAGGRNPEMIDAALDAAADLLRGLLG